MLKLTVIPHFTIPQVIKFGVKIHLIVIGVIGQCMIITMTIKVWANTLNAIPTTIALDEKYIHTKQISLFEITI